MFFFVLSLISLLVYSVSASCQCGGNPLPTDFSSHLVNESINSILNGIKGKSVGQCHFGDVNSNYNPSLDESILFSQDSGYQIYRIFQPNYYLDECYDSKLFCAYNVQCSFDQMLYYSFEDHDIENPSSGIPGNVCLDYIDIRRHGFPNQNLKTCGRVGIDGATYSTFNVIQSGYDIDSLGVSFRSNGGCSGTGYFLWVCCINVDPSPAIGKRQTTRENVITVPFKGSLVYYNYTLTVSDRNEKTLHSVSNIQSLRVRYEGSNNESTYTGPGSEPVTLNGEGQLNVEQSCRVIGYRRYCSASAHYTYIGVPHKLRLTPTEQTGVDMLMSGCVRKFQGKGEYSYIYNGNRTTGPLPTSTPRESSLSVEQTRNEQVTSSRPKRTNEPIPVVPSYTALKALAYKYSRSENAILRSVGLFYLQTS